jgi:hypothetical protein
MGGSNPVSAITDIFTTKMTNDANYEIASKQEDLAYAQLAQAKQLGQEAAEMAKFKPYGITSNIGSFNVSDTGQATMGLSPQQQAYENQLNQQAMTFTGVNPMVDPQGLFNAMQATRDPINQRNQLALEQRLAAQGRLGLGSAMYGGGTPEQFAMQQAMQEQLSVDYLNSLQKANQLTGQGLANQSSALGLSYIPQNQLQNLSQMGMNIGNAYNQQAISQGGLLSGTSVAGLQGFNQSMNNAMDSQAAAISGQAGLYSGLLQAGGNALSNWYNKPATANMYNTNLGSEQTRMLASQDEGFW